MRKLTLLLCVGLLSACVTPTPIPQDIQDKAAQIPQEDLPKNFHLEKSRCPSVRSHAFDKRMECKETVRRELAAREMMRKQNDAMEQENAKEQSDESIKN